LDRRENLLLSSNLAFSKWDQIFKDAMTTAAAIDRLVHHSVIIELNVPSYRVEKAKQAVSSGKSTTDEAPEKNSKQGILIVAKVRVASTNCRRTVDLQLFTGLNFHPSKR